MGNDAVVGYDMAIDFDTEASADGNTAAMRMSMQSSMDADNNMSAVIEMDTDNMFDFSMEMTGSYAATDKTPTLTPPEGASVISYEELLAASAAPEADA